MPVKRTAKRHQLLKNSNFCAAHGATANAVGPAEFPPPQANREVLLGDALVAYALHRSRRRTIGFTVGRMAWPCAPQLGGPVGRGHRAARTQRLGDDQAGAGARAPAAPWKAAALCGPMACSLPYLGQPLQVVLDATQSRSGRAGPCMRLRPTPRRGW